MFLQAIAIDDRAYEFEKSARSFANTLIFPGGCLPSLGAIQRSVVAPDRLRPVFLEDIGPSYVLTLRHWRERFDGGIRAARPSSATTSASAASGTCTSRSRRPGFAEARLRDLQIVFARPGWPGRRLPQSSMPTSVGSGRSSTPKAPRTPSRSSRASATSS